MKKIFSLVAAAGICASSAMAAVVYEPETEFKTIEELTASGGFAIINKTDGKALYGSNAQNLAYDVYEKAFVDTNSGYKWRLNADAGDGNYYLQLLTPAGADYNCWGMGGVLNSQGEPQGWACSFILGLSGEQKGQDIPNGACYTLAYSADNAGWSIRNVGTGQYQGFNNGPAHSDDPSYFQFVSLKKTEIADPVEEEIPVIASLASIIENGTTFLLNSADKYLYGSDNQNAAWTGDYVTAKAASNKVNQFKLEYITAGGKYLFHAYNEGNEVTIYGATPCYLNSQPAANGVIFIMGKDQDGKDGSSWKIAEVEGGYTIQNVANGAYLTSNGLSAEPAVFTIVADIPVASVALGEDFEMTVGDAAKTLTATILPENASSKTLTWSSSDAKVATVANGVVTAIGAGEAEIIAAANNGKADTVKVTVSVPDTDRSSYIANSTVDGATGWTIERPFGGNGPLLNNTAFEYWGGNATDRNKASFNYYQVINNLPAGKYILSAEMYNSSNTEAPVADHAPNGNAGLYISNGTTESFVGVTEDGTDLVAYKTQAINVYEGMAVTIGVKSIGYMSARWFVADNFRLSYAGETDPEVAVESVELGEDFEMTVGDADTTLIATVLPADASNKSLTWKSSAETVATVVNGVVKAVGAGEAEIIAASNNGKADTVKVTVEAAAVVAPTVEYVNLKTWNFRDASQYALDTKVAVASLTIEYDTVPDGTKLYQSTDAMWDGLVFQPAGNDGANSWWVRARNSGSDYGLARVNGTAWFAITDLHAGYKVTIEAKAAMVMADSSMVSEIVKNESTLCGQGVSYTYTMVKDGMLAFQQNGVYMYRIIIDAPIVARYTAHDWNFRDASQFALDAKVTVASLTIDYDTVPGGIMLKKSTDPIWDGLVFEPAAGDAAQSWWVRRRNTGTDYGLGAINQNRWFGIADLKAGAKVTLEVKDAMPMADSTIVSSIVKNESTTCGQGVSYTYTMAKDGMLAFRNNGVYMYRILVEQPVNYMVETVRDFRDASQYALDSKVTVASLTIDYDTVPGGIMLKKSTDALWDGLAFEPAAGDAAQSWWVRKRNTGTDYGLGAINQNRWFAVIDLRAGETVTIEAKAAMPLADSTMVSDIVKNESTACGQGVSYTYTMAKNGMLALQNNGVYMYRIITNQYGGLDAGTPMPTITAEGETYMANLITIECEAEGAAITYTIDDGEEQTYTEPFYLSSSAVIAAKADLNGVVSKTAYLAVTAGEIAAPTVSTIAAKNEERTVVIASATAPAYLKVNGDSVANNDTVKITATTNYEVVAVYVDEHVGDLLSDTVKVTVEAGSAIQLNEVVFAVLTQSDTAWTFIANNAVADIIGKPATTINYELYPSNEVGTVNPGDTLTLATHQRITASASAEGFATSEPTELWLREPAKLELVWDICFDTIAQLVGDKTVPSISAETFSVNGTSFGQLTIGDSIINANFGAFIGGSSTYLVRTQNKDNTGLEDYHTSSSERYVGIANLKKTQVLKFFTYRYDNTSYTEIQDLFPSYNDVLEYDAANSTASHIAFNVVKDGNARLAVGRYLVFKDVAVYNNPDVTASPNIYISGKEGDARNVTIIPATVAYPVNQFTYYAISNGTRVDSTLVTAATDSTEAVYQVDTVTVFNDFAPIAGEFTVSKPNNTVIAYTEYEGKASEQAIVEIDCDSIYSLLLPTLAWKDKTEEGHVLTVHNPNLVEQGLYPQLKVTYNGQSETGYTDQTFDCALPGSGWFTVQAILPGMDTAACAAFYVAEARESYNENYDGIFEGNTLTTSGTYRGDIEIAAGATVSGTYPTKAIAVNGTQFFHVAATKNFAAVTLPFAFTPGKNVVTDAKGNELVAGEDYEIATLHNLANGNVPTGKDAANVANFTNMAGCVRTSDLTAGTAILFRTLSEKVGDEVILVSDAKKPVAVAATATTMPTSGWKIYGNKRMQNVALENSVYVLNAAGDKLVLTENPTIAPMGVALMAEAATVQALGNEILLVGDPSAIDVVEDAISQFEVNTVYDLQGRQVETLKKGQVYLINGRRYMVK